MKIGKMNRWIHSNQHFWIVDGLATVDKLYCYFATITAARTWQMLVGAFLLISITTAPSAANQDKRITIFTTLECTCNNLWAAKLANAGFTIVIEDTKDLTSIKRQAGVPNTLQGCQTAVISEYILEGRIPLPAIKKLLSERPNVRGIALLEKPVGQTKSTCDVSSDLKVYAFSYDSGITPRLFYETGD